MANTLALNLEDLPCLTARRNLELGFAVQSGHLYLGAQRRLNKVDGQLVDEVIIVSGEDFMLFHGEGNVEVARRAAPGTGFTITAEAYLGTVIHPSRYSKRNITLEPFFTAAPALGAGVDNNSAFAVALITGGGVGKAPEEALVDPAHLSAAIAVGTSRGLGAGLAANTLAQ